MTGVTLDEAPRPVKPWSVNACGADLRRCRANSGPSFAQDRDRKCRRRRNPEFSPGVHLSEIAAVPRTQTDRGVLKEVEISLALWGGVWGIVMMAALPRALANTSYIVAGSAFGALLPSAVALLLVMPLKGQPMAGGGDVRIIIAALILNGLWGAGTALFIDLFGRARRGAVPDRVWTDAGRI
jgi:hypothetical protein